MGGTKLAEFETINNLRQSRAQAVWTSRAARGNDRPRTSRKTRARRGDDSDARPFTWVLVANLAPRRWAGYARLGANEREAATPIDSATTYAAAESGS